MTGYRSSSLRHDCRVDGCFQDTLPSWDWMRDCFPRGIMPTDVDGMVEIRGNILFIEQKRPGGSLTAGQRAALKAVASKPNTTVLCIRTHVDGGYERLIFDGTPAKGWQRCTEDWVRSWLWAWGREADEEAA